MVTSFDMATGTQQVFRVSGDYMVSTTKGGLVVIPDEVFLNQESFSGQEVPIESLDGVQGYGIFRAGGIGGPIIEIVED